MMRVTVKGVLLGGSVGVLITTVFLWTQCRPPGSKMFMAPVSDSALQLQNPQRERRQPLMTRNHPSDPLSGGEDYTDALVAHTVPKLHYNNIGSDVRHSPFEEEDHLEGEEDSLPMSEIACVINQETTITCRRDETDVFIPFSFIRSYFEVYGRINVNEQGKDYLEWSHSYSNVFDPQSPYQAIGKFLNFQSFNVEGRDRVKCISATEGVPISTQWQISGYTYPIQIAQFGLSHYSKFLEEPPPTRIVLENGLNRKAKFKYTSKTSSISREYNKDIDSFVLKFITKLSHSNKGTITLKVPENISPEMSILSMYMRLSAHANSTITVTLQPQDKKLDFFYLHYICSDKLIENKDQHTYYGMGHNWNWRYLTRNLLVDLLKGVAISSHPKKMKRRISKSKIRVVAIDFEGRGELSNVSLSTSEHIRHFYDAADWLLKHQDERGGWPIPVPRKVVSGILELSPGWYSAMAQGQAISLLVRAAHFSGNQKYIQSATKATKLLAVNVTKGGVRTYFPGGLAWYEEYPTTPSLFVLNGFMYSLLGLYDLKQSVSAPQNPSVRLFEEGMKSLKALLPLFDTGQGSLYDLRHFTSHVPPNVARWDYHTTHITQLLTLATVDTDEERTTFFKTTAQRWKGYMVGRRARHN